MLLSPIRSAATAADQMMPIVSRASRPVSSRDQSSGTDRMTSPKMRASDREPGELRVGRPHELKLSMMLIAAGPITAMKRQGRMQKISGMVILTGTCWAFSSAC